MEEYIYRYPGDGDTSVFDKALANSVALKAKNQKKLFALIGGIFLSFVFYCIPIFHKIDMLFLMFIVILSVILFYFAKNLTSSAAINLLAISAFKKGMTLEYFSGKSKKILHIRYKDIVSARFSDDNYTSFQIAFTSNDQSFIEEFDLNGNKLNVLNNNLFLFKINPDSYEQYFFFYLCDDLFAIEKFDRNKKFLKKYGNAADYLERLESEE